MVKGEVNIDIFDHIVLWMQEKKKNSGNSTQEVYCRITERFILYGKTSQTSRLSHKIIMKYHLYKSCFAPLQKQTKNCCVHKQLN